MIDDLPRLWLLSDKRNDARLETALEALPANSGFVFRHYHLDPSARRARFDQLAPIARRCGHVVLLSRACGWGEDGCYGAQRPASGLWLATAHNAVELADAARSGAQGAFLSPVFPTASHPGADVLGPAGFRALAAASPLPVIALGGMTHDRAKELECPRWGAIDGLA